MTQFVLDELAKKESEFGINVIYAWLGGSRHFNSHLINSDYDVFYIYDGVTSKPGINNLKCVSNCEYRIFGMRHETFLKKLLDGKKYELDAIRPDVVYIPNDKFTVEYYNLALTIDYNKFSLSFKNIVKSLYTSKYNLSTKRYKMMLMFAMRYLWVETNQSCMYPVDIRILLEYFINEKWYDSVKYVFDNLDKDLYILDLPNNVELIEDIIKVV